MAMAKVHTATRKANRLVANRWLKKAQTSANRADTRKNVNSSWEKHAGLTEIVQYLSR